MPYSSVFWKNSQLRMIGLLQKIFGSRNQRLLKRYQKTVAVINAREPEFQALSDEALRAKTEAFRQRASNGEALDALLREGVAGGREASRRALKTRHCDVQLNGGKGLQ